MCLQKCQQLTSIHVGWLCRECFAHRIGEACELTTPFLDRHNNHLQIYVVWESESIILSDNGYTLADLRTGGLDPGIPEQKTETDRILSKFGIETDGRQLCTEASPENFSQRLYSLIQAMFLCSHRA